MKEFNKLNNIYVVERHELDMFYTSDVGKNKVIIAKFEVSGLKRKLFEDLNMELTSFHVLVPRKYADNKYDYKHKYHYEYVLYDYEKALDFVQNLNKKICESK